MSKREIYIATFFITLDKYLETKQHWAIFLYLHLCTDCTNFLYELYEQIHTTVRISIRLYEHIRMTVRISVRLDEHIRMTVWISIQTIRAEFRIVTSEQKKNLKSVFFFRIFQQQKNADCALKTMPVCPSVLLETPMIVVALFLGICALTSLPSLDLSALSRLQELSL